MNITHLYDKKRSTPEEAITHINPGEDIITPLIAAEPYTLMKQLESYDRLDGNRLFQMLSANEIIDVAPDKLKIISMFMGATERKAFKEGKIDLLPNHFSDIPRLILQQPADKVVMAVVSPMDENGYFSLGTNCDHTSAIIPFAKTILLEVNENMPRTFGENQIHISDVTAFIDSDAPIPEAPAARLSEKDKVIGEYVAELIKDDDVLQIGFGSIPNAIIDNLKNHQNLSIHTEMIPEKIIELYESGSVTNTNNPFHKGKMTATFAFGSQKLYEFLHENHDVNMMPVNQTNDVANLAKTKNLVTINAGVEIDFLGQANSEKIGDTYWSSTGGQSDFQLASHLSEGGRGVLCLHSTAKEDSISKIRPTLNPGAPISTSKNDIDYVVTEHGIAKLRGKTVRERTNELIRVAHPDFRKELTFEAKNMGYL